MYLYTHTNVHSHTYSKKQQEDDKKAVERNRKELVRLDQQLKVSKIQFTKIRELNHELSRRLEEEKARTGDKEYTLKVFLEESLKYMYMYMCICNYCLHQE